MLCAAFSALVCETACAQVASANKALPAPKNVPELMKTFGGADVKTRDEWEKVRAPELLACFEREEYGKRPAAADERGRVSFETYRETEVFGGKEMEMPFDQHEMLALIAPRLLCVGSATEDHWCGPLGEWWSAKLASPAWELYGKKGLVGDKWPDPEKPQQEGCVSYWDRYMDFADKHGWRSANDRARK